MNFHHIGIATKDLAKSLQFIQKNFKVKKISQEIYDSNQKATLQMVETNDVNIELVYGDIVEKLLQVNTTYYHICYEVKDIHKAIENFQGALLISPPKEAILFENRLVAFLITPLGLIELLNET